MHRVKLSRTRLMIGSTVYVRRSVIQESGLNSLPRAVVVDWLYRS